LLPQIVRDYKLIFACHAGRQKSAAKFVKFVVKLNVGTLT